MHTKLFDVLTIKMFRLPAAPFAVLKSFFLYFIFNHCLSCGYFIIHRYFEVHSNLTWAIADGLSAFDTSTNRHDIASKSNAYCYSRAIYFVLSTLTSVGYGSV